MGGWGVGSVRNGSVHFLLEPSCEASIVDGDLDAIWMNLEARHNREQGLSGLKGAQRWPALGSEGHKREKPLLLIGAAGLQGVEEKSGIGEEVAYPLPDPHRRSEASGHLTRPGRSGIG